MNGYEFDRERAESSCTEIGEQLWELGVAPACVSVALVSGEQAYVAMFPRGTAFAAVHEAAQRLGNGFRATARCGGARYGGFHNPGGDHWMVVRDGSLRL